MRYFCQKVLRTGYSNEMEELMSKVDEELQDINLHDKMVRIRNLKFNLMDLDAKVDPQYISQDPRLIRLVDSIVSQYSEIQLPMMFYLISSLWYFEMGLNELWERICTDLKNNKIIITDSASATKLLLFFAKNKYFDKEVLEKLEDVLFYRDDSANLVDYVHQLWAFSVLGYYNYSTRYIEQFNERAHKVKDIKFHSLELSAKVLLSYSMINKDLDNAILKKVLKAIIDSKESEVVEEGGISKMYPSYKQNLFHSMTVILQSLVKLDIRNEAIFTKFANKIVCEGDESEVDYQAKEISQLFSCYVKAQFYNSLLMKKLEEKFVEKVDQALPETLANMLLSHLDWARFIVDQTFKENGSKELFYKFKPYHIKFVNLLLTNLNEKGVDGWNYVSWLIIPKMSNLKHLKNRNNARLILDVGIQGIS